MSEKQGNEISSILNTILERCKKEKDNGCLLVSLEDHHERVSFYTAYPKALIEEITTNVDTKVKPFNTFDHILLLRCIKALFQMKAVLTLKNLYEQFKKEKNLSNNASSNTFVSNPSNFYSWISVIGYEYRKPQNGPLILVENPKITFERFHYLSKLKKYRAMNKNIYYLDEKCINTNLSFSKVLQNKKCNTNEYIFLIMISEQKYEHGLFTTHIDEELYQKWVSDILLPMMKSNSVVVLNKSYLHGLTMKPITGYHSKKDMIKWLHDHNIPYVDDMHRADLFELIKKTNKTKSLSNIERIFQGYGHEVLHLPSTFEEVSPIEFMWKHMSSFSSLKNESIFVMKNNIYDLLTNVDNSIWKTFTEQSQSIENEIFDLDTQIDLHYDEMYNLDYKQDVETSCTCKFNHIIIRNEKNET